jgi:hypothetical protein
VQLVIGEDEHQLQFPYALWFSKRPPGKQQFNYEDNIKLVGRFASVSIAVTINVTILYSYCIWCILYTFRSTVQQKLKRQFFSISRICDEKCSKHIIFLAFLSKLLCFVFILWFTQLATLLNVPGG